MVYHLAPPNPPRGLSDPRSRRAGHALSSRTPTPPQPPAPAHEPKPGPLLVLAAFGPLAGGERIAVAALGARGGAELRDGEPARGWQRSRSRLLEPRGGLPAPSSWRRLGARCKVASSLPLTLRARFRSAPGPALFGLRQPPRSPRRDHELSLSYLELLPGSELLRVRLDRFGRSRG